MRSSFDTRWIPKLQKFMKPILFFLGILFLASLTYFAGISLNLIRGVISISRFHIIFLAILELFLFLLIIFLIFRSRAGTRKILGWRLSSGFAAVNLLVLFYLFNFYGTNSRAELVSVAAILKIVPFVFLLLVSSLLISLWNGFEGVVSKFLSEISFLDGGTVKKHENRLAKFILVLSIIAGAILRIVNLDFPLYVDEYPLTHAAIQMLDGVQPTYTRALYLIALPVSISFKAFGISTWAARFPMVLLNLIAIIPLYFLGKRIHKFVGVFGVLLYATNPWVISVSKNIREYTIVPVFFFSTALIFQDLLEIENLNIKQYFLRNKWRILILLLILGYSIYDFKSVVKVNFVNYAVFGILIIYKLWKRISSSKLKLIFAGFGIICFLALLLYINIPQNYINDFVKNIGTQYWFSLVNNPDRQWYFIVPSIGYLIIVAVLMLALFSFGKFQTKQDENISYIVLAFLALLAYLVFFLNKDAYLGMVRYGVLLEYWYVLIAALFFYLLYCLLKTFFREKYLGNLVLALLFFGLFVNYPSLSRIVHFKGGLSEITRETHMIVEPAYQFLIPLVKNNDVILTTFLYQYDELHQNKFKEIKILPYNDFINNKSVELQTILQSNPSGWIVLPDNKTFNIPYSDFYIENVTVDYLGDFGDLNIWHWFITD